MAHDSTNLVKSRLFGSVTRKAVMLVLVDYTDAEWSTFVGQERIAAEAEVSERTVRSVLADFESAGFISRTHRARKGERGGRTSDRIQIHRDKLEQLPAAFAANPPTQTATGNDPNGKAIAGEPSVEPDDVEVPPPSSSTISRAEFWARRWADRRGVVFTRSVRKSWVPAVQDFIKNGGEPSDRLLDSAEAADIKHPSGWGFVAGDVNDFESRQAASDWIRQ